MHSEEGLYLSFTVCGLNHIMTFDSRIVKAELFVITNWIFHLIIILSQGNSNTELLLLKYSRFLACDCVFLLLL